MICPTNQEGFSARSSDQLLHGALVSCCTLYLNCIMLYCRDNTADCAYTSKSVISHTFNTGYFFLNYSGNPGARGSTNLACTGLTSQFGRDTVCYREYGRRQPQQQMLAHIYRLGT